MEDFLYEYFLNPPKRLYWLYILSSIFIALIYLYFYKKQRRLILSKKFWFHKSVRLDIKYFLFSYLLKITLLFPLLFSVKEVAIYIYKFLVSTFGFVLIESFSYSQVIIFYTITIFILNDFSRFYLHKILHTNKFLWRFHKVHHSAKLLNPLTFYRTHPVENLLYGFRYAFVVGATTGLFVYLFSTKIDSYSILGANIFVFAFSIIGTNLRHSPIALSYPKILEYFFISPKQHQLHHSTTYYMKNYGSYLSIWDYLFNTLQTSQGIDKYKFGLAKKEMSSYESILGLLFTPLKKEKKNEIKNTRV